MTDKRLEGWGEIMAHLGVNTRRTVLRRGYPVRYYRETGRVYALASELAQHESADGHVALKGREQPQTAISSNC